MTPVPKKRIYPPTELFWKKVVRVESGCLEWIGAMTGPNADPRPSIQYHKKKYVPRQWAWVIAYGNPASIGLTPTCGNVMCVDPRHMSERRANVCIYGHDVSGDNLYIEKTGRKICKTCRRARQSTPRQREMQKLRRKTLPDEERRRRLHIELKRKRTLSRKRQAVRSAMEVALWSPEANRWIYWEGERWVRGGDDPVYTVVKQHLEPTGLLPRGLEARNTYVRDVMETIKVRRQEMENAA